MPRFTPAPWEVSDTTYRGSGHRYREISSRKYSLWIAHVLAFDSTEMTPEPSECKANAHLIAAAPDLYEVARMAEAAMLMETGEECAPDFGPQDLLEKARAALAKARGEA